MCMVSNRDESFTEGLFLFSRSSCPTVKAQTDGAAAGQFIAEQVPQFVIEGVCNGPFGHEDNEKLAYCDG